ncbi:Chaperone protein dnaJ 20 like [Actinidia chinensis var. chinensis]|uniref:Chaperone protein dnaJ 20 like n=1 Tax=Actinidia chinensis var. chinensis TaxID=1590841 RepID=A0A2R6QJS6_ACTCC|nr:Chaperone protein dnaJ 20 like [Actinidia chinensis var. chinensis]
MSYGMISGSEACFLLCTKPNLSTIKPKPESCSGLIFKTHLAKPILSLKTPSGSLRGRPRAAIKNLYGTAQATESFYDLLGVSESGTLSEIKKAYKQLALKYHPDVSPPDRIEEYTKTFICVQEAYQTLSDPKTRALYDSDLANGFNLASSRTRFQHDQGWGHWRDLWQSQLMELMRRSANNDSTRARASWGARMRRQRSQRFGYGFE